MFGRCKHDWDIVYETHRGTSYRCPHETVVKIEVCRQCKKCGKHKEPDRGW